MNREIPGFYYDPEKKKYFRIQASHKAAPGAEYSKDAVKRKRDEQEKHQRKVRHQKQVAREKIKRASCLYHPLIGHVQEVGARQSSKSALHEHQALLYANQLRAEQLHRFKPWPTEYTIKHVMRNRQTGTLIAGGSCGGVSSVSVCFPDWDRGRWMYDHTMEKLLCKEQYRLSSISLSHNGSLLAAMDSGPQGDAFLTFRTLPTPDEDGDYRIPSRLTHPAQLPMHEQTIWSTAAAPANSSSSTVPVFALGTSRGLQVVHAQDAQWTLMRYKVPYAERFNLDLDMQAQSESSHVEVTSVEWLSENVVAGGLRDSTVFLHDFRSNACATRLKHPSAVTGMKRVDPWRFVVRGVDADLRMYDLRYTPTNLDKHLNTLYSKRNPRNPHHRQKPNRASTKPYLVFPQDKSHTWSTNTSTLDFDLNAEVGLLAKASETSIVLFSLQTGEEIPSTYPVSQYRYPEPISALRFDSLSSGHTPGLLVCAGNRVDEWNWHAGSMV